MNYNEIVSLTQIMAVNGDVPRNVGGWQWSEGYAGGVHRRNGSLGEVAYSTDMEGARTAHVCIRGCTALCLPSDHADFVPTEETVWATVPRTPDMRFVSSQYHTRDGRRVRQTVE